MHGECCKYLATNMALRKIIKLMTPSIRLSTGINQPQYWHTMVTDGKSALCAYCTFHNQKKKQIVLWSETVQGKIHGELGNMKGGSVFNLPKIMKKCKTHTKFIDLQNSKGCFGEKISFGERKPENSEI